MNFFGTFSKTTWKIWPVNISKTTMNCFHNYLDISTSSIFSSSFGNFSKLFWKLFMHWKCFWDRVSITNSIYMEACISRMVEINQKFFYIITTKQIILLFSSFSTLPAFYSYVLCVAICVRF
jgi:hypothetical protein